MIVSVETEFRNLRGHVMADIGFKGDLLGHDTASRGFRSGHRHLERISGGRSCLRRSCSRCRQPWEELEKCVQPKYTKWHLPLQGPPGPLI